MTGQTQKTLIVAAIFLIFPHVARADGSSFPAFDQVQATIQSHLDESKIGSTDLISRNDVRSLLGKLKDIGWKVEDGDDILGSLLSDNHVLVKVLSTKHGQRFMRKVAGYQLIYDRLDRISQEPGGRQLLQSLIKLPDGHRYARANTPGAVPDLVAFLPKGRSGRTRRVADYNQPTGKIYTASALMTRLEESYRRAQ